MELHPLLCSAVTVLSSITESGRPTSGAEGKQARVVAGGLMENPDTDKVEYKKYRPELQFLTVPGLGKTEYQFIVSGGGGLTISCQSRHGGTIRKTVELK